MSEHYTKFHSWQPVSDLEQAFHQGYPELRGRHDLATPIFVGKDKGVPVVFWSRKPEEHLFGRGESIQGALDRASWRLDRDGGVVRYCKDLWR